MKAILLALCVAACAPVGSQPNSEPGESAEIERDHEAGRVKLWIPGGWAVDDSQGDQLLMSAPDQSVSMQVTLVDGQDLASALVGVAAGMLIGYDNLQLEGAPVTADINGMNALFQDGRGTYHGTPVELSVGLIDTPAEKYLLVVGEATPDGFADHERAIKHFIERIRPL